MELGAGDARFERIFAAMMEEISIRKLAQKTGISAATLAKVNGQGMDAISKGTRKMLEQRLSGLGGTFRRRRERQNSDAQSIAP